MESRRKRQGWKYRGHGPRWFDNMIGKGEIVMKNGLLQQATRFYQNWRRKQLWYRMVSGMACVVVFCTVYALILPAITMEKEPACGLEEHTHTEACYTVETVWPSTEYLCSEESLSGHVHGEDCCDEDGDLICGYADFVVHTHDESCYDRNGDLACPLEEIEEHRHDADCYSSTEVLTCGEEETGHVHDQSCYTRVRGDMTCGLEKEEGHTHGSGCYETERDLVCTLEEGEDHTHGESCYETRQVLTCELEESEGHTHGDDCYDWTEELTCGREEAEGHIHSADCYTTVRELVCDEEEVTLHTHDEDCFDEDGNLICGKLQVLEHQHDETCAVEPEGEPEEMQVLTCGLKEHTHTDACWDQSAAEEPAYLCGLEEHTHSEDCYDEAGELTCGLKEHVHDETCLAPAEALPDNAFPEELPEGYAEYTFDSEDGLSVVGYAPENAFGGQPVTLKAEKLAEDSQGYMDAQANLDAAEDVEYDGFVALDIRFEDEAGTEVEPDAAQGPVYVKLDALALLPDGADQASVAVQHHCAEAADPIVAVSAEPETVVQTVADGSEDTGTVEVTPTAQTLEEDSEQEVAALDVTAEFSVESFSTFTVTWLESYKLILHYVDTDGKSILEGDSETALATYSELESVTLSQYANRISHSGYAYTSAYVLLNSKKTTAVQVKYNKDANKWQYAATNDNWEDWMDGTNYTADVYLSYTAVDGNTIVPPENNVYPVDAINVCDKNANVILLYPKLKSPEEDITYGHIINIDSFFSGTDFTYSDWNVYRIENRGGRYQVIQEGTAASTVGVQVNDAYLLLVKKTYADQFGLYNPTAYWPKPEDNTALDGVGDTVQINLRCNNRDEKMSDGTPLAYLTFSPKNNTATADAREDDVAAVANSAIKFQLFDYSTKINRPNGSGATGWRPITPYFQFRGQQETNGVDNRYDEDGFTVRHATVERVLENNYPVLDPNRNALGGSKSPEVTEADLPRSERSLEYLFSSGDGAVTAYNPSNTILQKSGTHYYYNSAYNAVDYDIDKSVFRVRDYVERNSSTSTYGDAQKYYDFLPFNYTGGKVVGTSLADARTYNLESADVDYWFGMRMDVDFYQGKDGTLNGEDMVFHFSGDDDVWVFIDDVLVLDLGGTHGTVTGSINFATGEIQQYLDWNGTVGTEGTTSFPTTIKACYEAAGKDPNGGWNGDIFADYTEHTLSFFYMERGCAVANCAIDFNLPTLPDKSLQVAKTLTAADGADADVVKHLENTMEYKFRVVKADANGKPTNQLLITEGDTYTLSGAGLTENKSGTVGADGYFTLKAGQMAEFTNMLARFDSNDSVKKYVVQEVLPTGLTGQYQEVVYTVGSDTGTCKDDATTVETDFTGYNSPSQDADVGNLVNYTNKVNTEKLSTLAITKTQVGSSLNGPQTYYMKVLLGPDADSLSPVAAGTPYFVGDKTRYVKTEGIIALSAGETARLKLLAGTWYSVVEVADASGTALTGNEDYTPTYTNESGSITELESKVSVNVTNTFPRGSLELSKTVSNTVGGSTTGAFNFELRFPVEDGWLSESYPASLNGQESSLTFVRDGTDGTDAVATVSLQHGQTITVSDLPPVTMTITETNSDGYAVSWQVDGQDVYGNSVRVSVTNETTVSAACTNTTGYELPSTGGAGTTLYTAGGLALIFGAAILLYTQKKRRKEELTQS